MRLLFIRHAIARDTKPDAARALTPDGARKMERGARGLKACQPQLSLIATSPLTRARQTAAILARHWKGRVEVWPELAPGARPEALVARLARHQAMPALALVGHEPSLSAMVSNLVAGEARSFVQLKKGGACRVDFPGEVGPGQAQLRWLLTPRQLRGLG